MVKSIENIEIEKIPEVQPSKYRYIIFIFFLIVAIISFKALERSIIENLYLLLIYFFMLIIFVFLYVVTLNYLNQIPRCSLCNKKTDKIGTTKKYNIFKCSNGHLKKMKIKNPILLSGGDIRIKGV